MHDNSSCAVEAACIQPALTNHAMKTGRTETWLHADGAKTAGRMVSTGAAMAVQGCDGMTNSLSLALMQQRSVVLSETAPTQNTGNA
jgi:hypothetical protein